MKHVLIDYTNNVFIAFHQAKRQAMDLKASAAEEPIFTKEDVGLFYHIFIKKLNNFFRTYGKCIFCMEGKNSLAWRRAIYPEYKRNRDKAKTESDYLLLKECFPVLEELLTFYPSKILKIDDAEADDIIYTLAEKYQEDGSIIISTDSDLTQIMNKFENVEIYNPIKQSLASKRPHVLLEKAIIGDASDNIPGISRIGEKTFTKMMEDKAFFNEKMKGGNREIVELFLKIIDLSKMPSGIKQKILDEDEKVKYNTFDPDSIEAFFFEHRLKEHIENWGYVKGDIQLLAR